MDLEAWYVAKCRMVFGETITGIVRTNSRKLPFIPVLAGIGLVLICSIKATTRAEVLIRIGIALIGILYGHFFFP